MTAKLLVQKIVSGVVLLLVFLPGTTYSQSTNPSSSLNWVHILQKGLIVKYKVKPGRSDERSTIDYGQVVLPFAIWQGTYCTSVSVDVWLNSPEIQKCVIVKPFWSYRIGPSVDYFTEKPLEPVSVLDLIPFKNCIAEIGLCNYDFVLLKNSELATVVSLFPLRVQTIGFLGLSRFYDVKLVDISPSVRSMCGYSAMTTVIYKSKRVYLKQIFRNGWVQFCSVKETQSGCVDERFVELPELKACAFSF